MILTYYTLYLILFDQMLNSRVPGSTSFKRKLGNTDFSFPKYNLCRWELRYHHVADNRIYSHISIDHNKHNTANLFDDRS